MKSLRSNPLCGFIAASILALAAGDDRLSAQENIVALGRVSDTGVLVSSENTVSGVVTTVRTAAGDYSVTITAAGAFAGVDSNDFVVQSSIASPLSGDDTIKTLVTTVTADAVTFTVNVDDVENLTTPDDQVAADSPFFFILYRIPTTFPLSTYPRHLLGTGAVDSAGVLTNGVGVGGLTVTSALNAPGDYQVTLANPGGFVGDLATDYVLALTIKGTGTGDRTVRGEVSNVTSDNDVVFNIHTDDVQAEILADDPVSASTAFSFSVHRIPGTPHPGAGPNLVVALAGVGANGALLTAPNAFDGGTFSSVRNALGDYRVTIVSSGAFAGRTGNEFTAHANLNQSVSSEEGILADVTIGDANTLHIDVNINDLQVTGQAGGVAEDAAFSLVLLDSADAAERPFVRPDLRIGHSPNLGTMRGNNVYNSSTFGQKTWLSLEKLKWSKFHFALENDGTLPDRVMLNGTGKSRTMNTKYFRHVGGRKNITAQMTRAGRIEDPVNPGSILRYEGWVKYLSPRHRSIRKVNITALSLVDPSKVDAVRALVRSRGRN